MDDSKSSGSKDIKVPRLTALFGEAKTVGEAVRTWGTIIGVIAALVGGGIRLHLQIVETAQRVERLERIYPTLCKMCWVSVHSREADRICADNDRTHLCWSFKPIGQETSNAETRQP